MLSLLLYLELTRRGGGRRKSRGGGCVQHRGTAGNGRGVPQDWLSTLLVLYDVFTFILELTRRGGGRRRSRGGGCVQHRGTAGNGRGIPQVGLSTLLCFVTAINSLWNKDKPEIRTFSYFVYGRPEFKDSIRLGYPLKRLIDQISCRIFGKLFGIIRYE